MTLGIELSKFQRIHTSVILGLTNQNRRFIALFEVRGLKWEVFYQRAERRRRQLMNSCSYRVSCNVVKQKVFKDGEKRQRTPSQAPKTWFHDKSSRSKSNVNFTDILLKCQSEREQEKFVKCVSCVSKKLVKECRRFVCGFFSNDKLI